jgi:hypothetical protein
MQTLVIDTYKVIKRLQERGFTKDQAEALVSVAQEMTSPTSSQGPIFGMLCALWKCAFTDSCSRQCPLRPHSLSL